MAKSIRKMKSYRFSQETIKRLEMLPKRLHGLPETRIVELGIKMVAAKFERKIAR